MSFQYTIIKDCGNSYHNTINGGLNNSIFKTATKLTGNVISGGGSNSITANYSFIGSGHGNQVAGNCSAILGGSGNTVAATYSYAGIFGCNISAVCSCAFHVNALWANAIPAYSVLLVPGTIYCATTAPFPGAKALWIV